MGGCYYKTRLRGLGGIFFHARSPRRWTSYFQPSILIVGLLWICPLLRAHANSLELRPSVSLVAVAGNPALVAFLVYSGGNVQQSVTVSLTCQNVEASFVHRLEVGVYDGSQSLLKQTHSPFESASADFRSDVLDAEFNSAVKSFVLQPKKWKIISARVSLKESADVGELVCQAGDASARVAVVRGVDLTCLTWKRTLTARAALPDARWASPDVDDSKWSEICAPSLWHENDYAWCRVHITVPERWRGRKVRFVMGAVDDNDVTYLNGEEIGRTNGWAKPRDYVLPERLIRWGEDNVLTVMVDNPTYGGGLYKPPYLLLAGDSPIPSKPVATVRTSSRPRVGKIGKPLPLRRMKVADGVLRYPDGAEVSLWGVNYYPQSWHQFDNMKKLGVDMKATIREDLNHLQRMGVEVIRIHVFDREISDGAGNIVPNVHLDLLDYLVAECSRRGIYMYFTPIAWWGGPNERKGAFSAETSKPGMMFVPSGKAAAANYLKQFLNHVNHYSGRRYKDEPCVCLLEVMNEPAYFLYGDLHGSGYTPQGERPDVLERDRQIFRDLWQKWLVAHGLKIVRRTPVKMEVCRYETRLRGLEFSPHRRTSYQQPSISIGGDMLEDSPVYFPLFRYELMRQYVREMIDAIRSTGATQPVAISYFGVNGDDLTQAIADSECDAVTVSAYPGGWERVNDGINLLPQMGAMTLDPRLNGKARLAYEFDTPATNTSCYLFPAIAASFRSGEVQVVCQFQYDSVSTARWNTDWNAHWLNYLYTPSKTVSFLIGGETFRRLPRGIRFTAGKDELKLGQMTTSFTRNLSLFVAADTVMYSRGVRDGIPQPYPSHPSRIVGVGSSPYVEYSGTGLYVLESKDKHTLRLTLNPDARLVGNCLQGSFSAPVAELEENVHLFRLKLPGWKKAQCFRVEGKSRRKISSVNGGWLLSPGEYEIRRS